MITADTLPDLAAHCRSKSREHRARGRIGRAAELDQIAAALDRIAASHRAAWPCPECNGRGAYSRPDGSGRTIDYVCRKCRGTGRAP